MSTTMTTFNFLALPMDIALLIIEIMPVADLAAFVQSSKTAASIALPFLHAADPREISSAFEEALEAEDHRVLIVLAPVMRRLSKTHPKLAYEALVDLCTTDCADALQILIGGDYTFVTNLEDIVLPMVEWDYTAMLYAMSHDSTIPLQTLLNAGGSLQKLTYASYLSNPSHEPPHEERFYLHHAAMAGAVAAVHLLLSNPRYAYKQDVNRADSFGFTPLMFAIECEKDDVIRLLLAHGADVDCLDKNRRTALSYAAEYEQSHTVSLLARYSPNASIRDTKGRTALHWAARSGVVGIVSPILESAYAVNIHAKDSKGWTALHYAAGGGDVRSIKVLLGKGARTDIKDCKGRVPVAVAIENQHPEAVLVLRDAFGPEVRGRMGRLRL